MAALTQRAASLLPSFDNEIVSKLIGWFELLAWVIGNCLAGFAMLRIVARGQWRGFESLLVVRQTRLVLRAIRNKLWQSSMVDAIGYEIATERNATTVSSPRDVSSSTGQFQRLVCQVQQTCSP